MFQKVSFLKAILLPGALIVSSFLILASVLNSSLVPGDDWDQVFYEQYGDSLDSFYYLGENGFQARWLTESEDQLNPCQINEHCVHIVVASIADCPVSARVKFDVEDSKNKSLVTLESEEFIVQKGKTVILELGSSLLTEKGFIEPLDAYCTSTRPVS